MPFVPVTNTAMVEVRWSLDSQRCENTLYFSRDTPIDVPALENLIQVVEDWWRTEIAASISDQVVVTEIFGRDLTTATGVQFTKVPTPALGGTHGGTPLPNNCALCVSLRSAFTGRSARGRNYVGGLPEGQVNRSVVDGVLAEAIRSGYESLLALADVEGWDWSVVSRFTNGAPRPSGVIFPILSVVLVDQVIDSQRNRLPGRGT